MSHQIVKVAIVNMFKELKNSISRNGGRYNDNV